MIGSVRFSQIRHSGSFTITGPIRTAAISGFSSSNLTSVTGLAGIVRGRLSITNNPKWKTTDIQAAITGLQVLGAKLISGNG